MSPSSVVSRPGPAPALVAIAALLLPVGALDAQVALVTDRPDFTESAVTVRPGRIQLEGGYTFSRTGAAERHTAGELLARIGVSGSAELRVGVSSVVVEEARGARETGVDDATLGAKLSFAGGGMGFRKPSAALLLSTTLPTGSDGFGARGVRPSAILALGWVLSERIALGANVGLTSAKAGGERFGQGRGSASLGVALDPRTGAYAEIYGFTAEEEAGPETAYVDAGLTRLLSPDLQIDLRVGLGLNDPEPDYLAGAGLAWRH